MLTLESAARIGYEAKREFDWISGDYNDTPWVSLKWEERELWIAMAAVVFSEPTLIASDILFLEWTEYLVSRGWTRAEKKKLERKQSHWLVKWHELADWQRKSFVLFAAVLNCPAVREGRLIHI